MEFVGRELEVSKKGFQTHVLECIRYSQSVKVSGSTTLTTYSTGVWNRSFGITKNEFKDLTRSPIGIARISVHAVHSSFLFLSKYKDPSNSETMHYLYMNM